ncbi:troponin C isoform X1 [Solenopsis invicta]|nr:troponin C isoform X1 [Solenopsis invicta]
MHGTSCRALSDEGLANHMVPACLCNPLHAFDFRDLQICWFSKCGEEVFILGQKDQFSSSPPSVLHRAPSLICLIPCKVSSLITMEEDDQKVAVMRKAFQMFDTTKSGFIETMKISTILNTMGQLFDDGELNTLIEETDTEGLGKVNFDGFCKIAGRFLEEEDAEAMQEELKEAFRLYDREGNGYITTATLKEILAALDDKLTSSDLDGIIAEIDTDGSGTVDFDEFMEMMTGE